jgi:large subunit ribosomal protein L30
MKMLEITYRRSAIGRPERQRRTIAALGLHRLHETVRQPDNESIRGMVASVHHLVEWREVESNETA